MPFRDLRLANVSPHSTCPPGRHPRGSRGRPRHPGQLHVAGGRPGRRRGRGDRVFLRAAAGDHRDDGHGQGRSVITGNSAREGGGALFFVSDDKTGTLTIERSQLHDNPHAGFQSVGYPGIFFLGQGHPMVLASSLS
jgi:hypothetical protein